MIYTELVEKIRNNQANLGIIGLGYVGLPLAIHFRELGCSVHGFDIDEDKINKLNNGKSYINHIEDKDIEKLIQNGDFATSDFSKISDMDILFVCVPTPIDSQRSPFMGHIIDTSEAISKYLRKSQLVLIESSTYPGTTNELIKPILEKSGLICHEDFYLAYSPEREDPGNKKYDISSIPKVVGADNPKSLDIALEIYSKLTETFAMNSSYEAEAVKLTENIFRSVNIALVNELKTIYDHMGVDTWNVIDGAATKPFGFMPFYPGPGIGGHCIPVDPFYLTYKAREYSLPTKFIELAGEINSSMPTYIVNKCQDHLNKGSMALHGSNVLICGVAYKKNVDDLRESPCLEIMDLLQKKGANLYFNDPLIKNIPSTRKFKNLTEIRSLEISPESLKKIDLVVVCTDHDGFDYDCLINNSKRLIDTRSCLPKESYDEYIVKA